VLLPESILHSDSFKMLATFVALNTLMYVTLAVLKVLPKAYVLSRFSGRNRRTQNRSIYPEPPAGLSRQRCFRRFSSVAAAGRAAARFRPHLAASVPSAFSSPTIVRVGEDLIWELRGSLVSTHCAVVRMVGFTGRPSLACALSAAS